MNKIEINYDLIDEIMRFFNLDDEEFEDLRFDRKKEILQLHNEMIKNKLKEKNNELIDERNKFQYEMNGLIAIMNSKLEKIGDNLLYIE